MNKCDEQRSKPHHPHFSLVVVYKEGQNDVFQNWPLERGHFRENGPAYKCYHRETASIYDDCEGISVFCKRRLVFNAAFENLDPSLKRRALKDIVRDALFASPEEPGEFFFSLFSS